MPDSRSTAAADVHTDGVTVERRFTDPGLHPFDAVEWELRDAHIGHGDKVSFEQRDVEFPTTWSQNATNIVAQKYFRGRLGSDERESSVRQMIGRVAGTIAGRVIVSLPGSEAAVRLAVEKLLVPELGHLVREATR